MGANFRAHIFTSEVNTMAEKKKDSNTRPKSEETSAEAATIEEERPRKRVSRKKSPVTEAPVESASEQSSSHSSDEKSDSPASPKRTHKRSTSDPVEGETAPKRRAPRKKANTNDEAAASQETPEHSVVHASQAIDAPAPSDQPPVSVPQEPLDSASASETPKENIPLYEANRKILTRKKGTIVPKTESSQQDSNPSQAAPVSNAQSSNAPVDAPPVTDAPSAPEQASSPSPNPNINTIDFNVPTVRLTRKKGSMVDAPKEAPPVENYPENKKHFALGSPRSEETEPFTPKSLTIVSLETMMYNNFMALGADNETVLELPITRKKGVLMTPERIREREIHYSRQICCAIEDRAPALQSFPTPSGLTLMAKLPQSQITSLAAHLMSPDTQESMRGVFEKLSLILSVDPYNLIEEVYEENPEAEAEATEPAPEDPGPDPVIETIFEIFERPLVALKFDPENKEKLRALHHSYHAGNITALFCDWARSLEYIDKGVTGGPEKKQLSKAFIERFEAILTIDFESARAQGVYLFDDELKQRYRIDNIDLLLLWLMASHEIDPNFRNAMRATWDQVTVVYMSPNAIMRFFNPNPQERAELIARLAPSSRMSASRLIRVVQGNVPTQPLSYEIIVSEQIVRQFVGVQSLSASSVQFSELLFPHINKETFLSKTHYKTLDILKNYLERDNLCRQPNLERDNLNFIPSMGFLIEGLPGSGRGTLVKQLASELNRPVVVIQGSPLSGVNYVDCEEYLKGVFSDASLLQAFICVRDAGPLITEEHFASIFARQLSLHPVVCAFCCDLAVKIHPVIEPAITFKVKMDANLKDNAIAFWQQHLKLPDLNQSRVDLRALSQRMALQPFQIQKATKLAYYSSNKDDANEIFVNNNALERAAAVQVTKNIGNLAFVSDPEIDLTDVIVSEDIMMKIKQIIGSAINRRTVLYEWGLSRRIRRGTGVIALFDGEPGTGKTHSAEAIAHELGLSLMRINIATMVDKYIGETEKNLTTIFEQARPDMQLLLFDEADSLFTKRTANVSKSNDRYSNMSVNVLLQLVERYEGVSILTTNLKNAIDPAFERRITYKVYFPMPKQPERERLWRYMCPPDILTAEPIDYEWLSELEMSGGEIKNAVLTAAFNAATQGVLLDSAILYNAGVAEASAAGRVMRRYEEGEDFMRE